MFLFAGSDAQSSEELDDIELPAAEFPMDALEMYA